MSRKEGVHRRRSDRGPSADAKMKKALPVCSEPGFFFGKLMFCLVFESAFRCAQPGSSLLFRCVGTVPLVSETGGPAAGPLGSDCRGGVRCLPAMCLRKCRLALSGSPTPQPTSCQQRAGTPGGASLPVDPLWIRMGQSGPGWLVKSGVAFFLPTLFSRRPYR